MFSAITLFLSLAIMLGLFWSAWWVLRQPLESATPELPPPARAWQNEPTAGRAAMPEPPSWAPAEEQASIASPRTHSTSDAHTAFYNRTDLCQQGAESTKTEILEELEGKTEEPPRFAPPPPVVKQG